MKTITLKNTEIEEMVYAPGQPMTIRYKLMDEQDNVQFRKTRQVVVDDIPQGKNPFDSFLAKLLTKLEQDEGL